MGFQRPPQWRGETVYLPSYAPVYGTAGQVLPAVEGMIEQAVGLWVPLVLHWGWEAEAGWRDLVRLAARISPYTVHWEDFRAAIDRSRAATGPGARSAGRVGEPGGSIALGG
jgi:hypothetical protein